MNKIHCNEASTYTIDKAKHNIMADLHVHKKTDENSVVRICK